MIGIQDNCVTFGNMSSETYILLQEKLAGLQGSLRQLKEDKIQLLTEIHWLKKEKDIMLTLKTLGKKHNDELVMLLEMGASFDEILGKLETQQEELDKVAASSLEEAWWNMILMMMHYFQL